MTTDDTAARRSPATVTPARYRTELAAVAFEAPEAAVYLRFRQDVTGDAVHRRYAGWRLDVPDGSRVLTIRDSLPAPRAAWRVLPGPGLRLVAGEGEEPDGLLVGGEDAPWEIHVDSTLASWPGASGQRERMALGRLVTDTVRPALVVLRREARPLDAPSPRAPNHLFVLVDGQGAGVVALARGPLRRTEAEAPGDTLAGLEASVRIRDGTEVRTLEGVRLVPREEADRPTTWTLRGPGGEEAGRLDLDPAMVEMRDAGVGTADSLSPAEEDDPDGSETLTLGRVSGSLEALDAATLRGLHVVVRGG
ncbi:MAG: hypothetical protein ACOC83_03570 [Gemmatimonadota bacterium]